MITVGTTIETETETATGTMIGTIETGTATKHSFRDVNVAGAAFSAPAQVHSTAKSALGRPSCVKSP